MTAESGDEQARWPPILGLARESAEGINIVHNLGEEEYRRYSDAAGLANRLSLQRQYALVERNFRKFKTIRAYFAAGFQQGTLDSAHFEAVVSSYNSALVTWLESTRSFLDHNKVALHREYADEPEKIAAYEAATSVEFDSSAAYRIGYKLRDYTVHCDFPVSEIRVFLRNGIDRSDGSELRLWLRRDTLLQNHFNWPSRQRKDLEALPEKFEFDSMADEFMECLRRLHWALIDDRVTRIASVQPVIKEAHDRIFGSAEPVGRGILVRCEIAEDGQSLRNIERTLLPVEMSTKAVETVNGNQRPSDFVRELAASADRSPAARYDDKLAGTLEVGTAVMAAYLSCGGFSPEFAQRVNNLIEEHDDLTPVVEGIAAVANISLQMTAMMHDTTPEEILGSLNYHAGTQADNT